MDSKMIEYIVDEYENQYWYLNGKWHREDGPAIIRPNGSKYWYQNGKRHREDGPAVIQKNGRKEWYLNGIQYEPQDIFNINTQFSIKNGF